MILLAVVPIYESAFQSMPLYGIGITNFCLENNILISGPGIITAMVTIVVTLLLIYGVKSNKSFYFLPWLVENVTGVVIAFGVSGVKLLSGTTGSVVGSLIFMFVILPCYCYWIYGVASLFVILRRMKKHTHQIISSVMQGTCLPASCKPSMVTLSRSILRTIT